MVIVCTCNHCSERLEFDAENTGETIPCPHCGLETILFIPEVPIGVAARVGDPPPPAPEPKKAELIKRAIYIEDTTLHRRLEFKQSTESPDTKNLETRLQTIAGIFLLVGIIGGVIGGIACVVNLTDLQGNVGIWFVVAVVSIIQGIALQALFEALAAIIRLLQESNRGKFAGKLTDYSVRYTLHCGLCDATTVRDDQTHCSGCGAEFYK
jgi:hypothetical protein